MPAAALPLAPGAKAAKTCGLLSLLFALTVVGFPVALVLGVVALVQHAKAKRQVQGEPGAFQPLSVIGRVTGVVGLLLPMVLVPLVAIFGAGALPTFRAQRERAQLAAVQANLDLARRTAEAAVLAFHAKSPGQVPSPDGIIRELARDPAILALQNPVTRGAPALTRGLQGPLGAVAVTSNREQVGGVTSWSLRFRARVRQGDQTRTLEAEVITHTEEQVQGRTEDGWDVVSPSEETPAPPN